MNERRIVFGGAVMPTGEIRMTLLETDRLCLRRIDEGDADFLVELLNEPAFLENIGDKGVRSFGDVPRYLGEGPLASYSRYGYGLYLVQEKANGMPVGMCGVLKRDGLADPDLGFAYLARYHGRGYASEAGAAVLAYERRLHGLGRIVAITSMDNRGSMRVLEKLGFRDAGTIRLAGRDEETRYFVSEG